MLNPRPTALPMDTATFSTTKSHGKPDLEVSRQPTTSPSTSCCWRQVRFSNDENDTQNAPHEELSPEMINDMWYTHEEMKHQVRSIVCRHLHCENFGWNSTTDNISALQRYSPQRSEYKQTTLRCILQAQNQSSDPDFIRSVSIQCTVRARALAANQGLEDYCEVYDPLDSLLGSASPEKEMDYGDDREQKNADAPTTKRKQEDHPHDDARTEVAKRRRLSSI
mmetsp:Transcript_8318/g.20029  ORF Transcript_8318/g.20029 Transcript_8318/m.20029 type:complete len:223 (-) Transcript_8318:45-713(-)